MNSQKYLYCLAARAAETSSFLQQNPITQLGIKAPRSSSARRCGILLHWVLEEVTERTQNRPKTAKQRVSVKAKGEGRQAQRINAHASLPYKCHCILNTNSSSKSPSYRRLGSCLPDANPLHTKVMQR